MERISRSELYMVLVLEVFTTGGTFFFAALTDAARYESVAALCAGAVAGTLLAFGALKLARRHPESSFFDYGTEIVGKWLHVPLAALFSYFFLHLAAYLMREFTNMTLMALLPETPGWAIVAIFGICVALAIRSGMESIFRVGQSFFFIILLSVLFTTVLLTKDIPFHKSIAFITHHDVGRIWSGGVMSASLFGELVLVLVLYPMVAGQGKAGKTLLWAALSALLLCLNNLVPLLLTLTPYVSGHMNYPVLELQRMIRAGDFLENVDPLLVAIWMTGFFVKIALFIWITVHGFSKLFGLKDYRPLAFPFTAITAGLSLHMSENSAQLEQFFSRGGILFILIAQCIPLLYLVVSWIRGKRSADAVQRKGHS
jgi:spore germination protein KB